MEFGVTHYAALILDYRYYIQGNIKEIDNMFSSSELMKTTKRVKVVIIIIEL